MFAAVNTILRRAGLAILAAAAAVCVHVLSGLALVLALILAAPLKRLRAPAAPNS